MSERIVSLFVDPPAFICLVSSNDSFPNRIVFIIYRFLENSKLTSYSIYFLKLYSSLLSQRLLACGINIYSQQQARFVPFTAVIPER